MPEVLHIGFGDAAAGLHAIVTSAGGGLLVAGGETKPLADAEIETSTEGGTWHIRCGDQLDVELRALGEPATFPDGTREWQCRAAGVAGGNAVDCLGNCTSEPAADFKRIALRREVSAWLTDDLGFACRAERPAAAATHDREALWAFALRGEPLAAAQIADPRLSTVYGGDGRQRQAGLELWEAEDSEFALRIAGEALAGGDLALGGGAVLRCAFLRVEHDGHSGTGRYDIEVASS